MKGAADWNDLALFSVVARTASLTRAATQTGSSQATLSRRMKVLEERVGRRLFLHGAQGYTPTPDGRELLKRAERMEAVAAEIARWQDTSARRTRVRISAGTWTSLRLLRNIEAFWQPDAAWVPEFLFCNVDMDIARREIDIGVRNKRPDQVWLAGRKTSDTRYAAYGRDHEVSGWIGASGEAGETRTARWVQENHSAGIVTTSNDPRLALALAEAGIGRIVLPCEVGDGNGGLRRLSDPIDELQSEEWLVCHHEARHEPPIRAALDALSAFLSGKARRPLD